MVLDIKNVPRVIPSFGRNAFMLSSWGCIMTNWTFFVLSEQTSSASEDQDMAECSGES